VLRALFMRVLSLRRIVGKDWPNSSSMVRMLREEVRTLFSEGVEIILRHGSSCGVEDGWGVEGGGEVDKFRCAAWYDWMCCGVIGSLKLYLQVEEFEVVGHSVGRG
jgi:hypothetical protein